ncbi:MAG: hypothetical protein P8H42_02215 [Saprospiraceae bacterium]|nr:hypothetical protein [Saprospiraceae bacterium]
MENILQTKLSAKNKPFVSVMPYIYELTGVLEHKGLERMRKMFIRN